MQLFDKFSNLRKNKTEKMDSSQLVDNYVKELGNQLKDAERRLSRIAQRHDPDALYCSVYLLELLEAGHNYRESTHGHISSMLEMLASMLFKQKINRLLKPTVKIVRETRRLLSDYHRTFTLLPPIQSGYDLLDPELQFSMKLHSAIVRGSGYPEQTSKKIIDVHSRLNHYYKKSIKVSAKELVDTLWAVGSAMQDKFNGWFQAQSAEQTGIPYDELVEKAKEILPISYSDLDSSCIRIEALSALIDLIGMTQDRMSGIKNHYSIKDRPLICLSNNTVVFADISNALDALWNALENQIIKSKHAQQYYRIRSEWTATAAKEIFQRVFGEEYVFSGLDYSDPDHPGSTAELDLLIQRMPFLVIGEVKSGHFRELRSENDAGKVKSDIKSNIYSALSQAERAKRLIEANSSATFRERKSGKSILIRQTEYSHIYCLGITLGDITPISLHIRDVLGEQPERDESKQYVINLNDLNLIMSFVEYPEVFIHYLSKRIELIRSGTTVMADELTMYGAYLECRLRKEIIIGKDNLDLVHLTGYSDKFDDFMRWIRGEIDQKPNIQLCIPDSIRGLIEDLSKSNEPKDRAIMFELLSLSNAQLQQIEMTVSNCFERAKTERSFIGLMSILDDLAVYVAVFVSGSGDMNQRSLFGQLRTQMYKNRIRKGFGIGLSLLDQTVAQVWLDIPWQYDVVMEEIIAKANKC